MTIDRIDRILIQRARDIFAEMKIDHNALAEHHADLLCKRFALDKDQILRSLKDHLIDEAQGQAELASYIRRMK